MSDTDALQRTLAAEHAAIWVLSALGAQSSPDATPALAADLDAAYAQHRARRDQVSSRLRDLGQTPVPPEPTYALPARLGTAAALRRSALEIEEACAATYGFLVAHTTGEARAWATAALTDAAVRGLTFGGTPENLPGIDV